MDLVVTPSSLLPNTPVVVLSGILMISTLCPLGIRLELRYKILPHKMVTSMVCILLQQHQKV